MDLIERLEKATGPNTDLDIAIGRYINGPDYQFINRYTASLDAALTLVLEGIGWQVNLGSDHDNPQYHRRAFSFVGRNQYVDGATPAISICIAALKARVAAD